MFNRLSTAPGCMETEDAMVDWQLVFLITSTGSMEFVLLLRTPTLDM